LFTEAVVAELDKLLAEFAPEIVVLETLWLHRYVDYFKMRGCRVILDAHNVEGPLHASIAAATLGGGRWLRHKLAEHVGRIEAATLNKVDQIWVCSATDAALVEKQSHPRSPIAVIPNTLDVSHYSWLPPALPREPTLLFPALFSYPPNEKAALYLCQQIWPRLITHIPTARLLLVGGQPTPALVAASQRDPSIRVTGTVYDIRPYLAEAFAMPVPIFEGGGTRYKILEAFASGVPVVSTAKGVEGLAVKPGVHYLAAETAGEFVAALVALHRDPDLARRLADRARALVSTHYSWGAAAQAIETALAS
jgi:glycosyltransferase involved in cell wall biosynthesis